MPPKPTIELVLLTPTGVKLPNGKGYHGARGQDHFDNPHRKQRGQGRDHSPPPLPIRGEDDVLEDGQGNQYTFRDAPVGSIWSEPRLLDYPELLSDFYHRHNSSRPPIYLILPVVGLFSPDRKRAGPDIEVHGSAPRINIPGTLDLPGFHGMIHGGKMTVLRRGNRH